jgi:hypothetical protein
MSWYEQLVERQRTDDWYEQFMKRPRTEAWERLYDIMQYLRRFQNTPSYQYPKAREQANVNVHYALHIFTKMAYAKETLLPTLIQQFKLIIDELEESKLLFDYQFDKSYNINHINDSILHLLLKFFNIRGYHNAYTTPVLMNCIMYLIEKYNSRAEKIRNYEGLTPTNIIMSSEKSDSEIPNIRKYKIQLLVCLLLGEHKSRILARHYDTTGMDLKYYPEYFQLYQFIPRRSQKYKIDSVSDLITYVEENVFKDNKDYELNSGCLKLLKKPIREKLEEFYMTCTTDALACFTAFFDGSGARPIYSEELELTRVRYLTGAHGLRPIRTRLVAYLVQNMNLRNLLYAIKESLKEV